MHQRNCSSISIQHRFLSFVICWCLTWLSELEQKARRNSITFQITSEIEFINQLTLLSIPSSFKWIPLPNWLLYAPFDSILPVSNYRRQVFHTCISACTSHPTANLTAAWCNTRKFLFQTSVTSSDWLQTKRFLAIRGNVIFCSYWCRSASLV